MANAANPELAAAMQKAPIVVAGSDCTYDPFAKVQATPCGKVLDTLSKKGVAYSKLDAPEGSLPKVTIGGLAVDSEKPGQSRFRTGDSRIQARENGIAVLACDPGRPCDRDDRVLVGMTYGPVAALLVELFPARIRYTSMSVPTISAPAISVVSCLHQPIHRREDWRSVCRPLVYLRGGGARSRRHAVRLAGNFRQGTGLGSTEPLRPANACVACSPSRPRQ